MTPLPAALDGWFHAAGAAAWGAVPYQALTGAMSPAAQARVTGLCPHAATVLVAAFPYYGGGGEGNLSLYARGRDYHRVLTEKLTPICNLLTKKYPTYSFSPGVDSSPLPEREAARLAGLGVMGQNGLVLLPPYGSFVFLGTILTDAPFSLPLTAPAPDCLSCGKCAAACPTGAIGEAGVDPARCLSALTQRKGDLTGAEEALLRAHPLIWGCDLCQTVCPYNAAPALSPLPAFREGQISSLTAEDVAGLTRRAFDEKYGDRAFAWRGPQVLRRNLALKSE